MTGASDHVGLIGDEHRDRVWRDRNGDYWRYFRDEHRQGWQYQHDDERWRFGAMHLYRLGPFTLVGPFEEYADD